MKSLFIIWHAFRLAQDAEAYKARLGQLAANPCLATFVNAVLALEALELDLG